jgi:hypothetical protein
MSATCSNGAWRTLSCLVCFDGAVEICNDLKITQVRRTFFIDHMVKRWRSNLNLDAFFLCVHAAGVVFKEMFTGRLTCCLLLFFVIIQYEAKRSAASTLPRVEVLRVFRLTSGITLTSLKPIRFWLKVFKMEVIKRVHTVWHTDESYIVRRGNMSFRDCIFDFPVDLSAQVFCEFCLGQ